MSDLPVNVDPSTTGHDEAHEALHEFYNRFRGGVPVVISAVDPGFTSPGLWVKYVGNGNYELWIEDGQ